MPKLNILQHKSYHPYLEKNRERVRKDEEQERLRIEAEEQRSLQADSDARLALLRGQAPARLAPPEAVGSSSSTGAGLPQDPFYAAQPDGERRPDRKGKSRAKQDDMRALDRLLLNGGGGSVGKGKDDEATSAAPPRPAAGADDSLSFYGKDGHLNFWASEEMRPPHNLPDKKAKKTPEELEKDDPYTMYLTRPERELKPWYTDPQLRKVEDRAGRDQALDRKRERRLRKDDESKLKRDPLTHIQSLFSSSRSSSSTASSARPPARPPADATPTDRRLLRESSERERALALVALHRRRSSTAGGVSEPSTPAVSLRSATPSSTARSGGWAAEGGGAYGSSIGYGESRFHPEDLRRVERERNERRAGRR